MGFLFYSLYLCVHTHACPCMHVQSPEVRVLFSLCLIPLREVPSSLPCFSWVGSQQAPVIHPHHRWSYVFPQSCPVLSSGAGDLNSGPHPCTETLLATESSPQSLMWVSYTKLMARTIPLVHSLGPLTAEKLPVLHALHGLQLLLLKPCLTTWSQTQSGCSVFSKLHLCIYLSFFLCEIKASL